MKKLLSTSLKTCVFAAIVFLASATHGFSQAPGNGNGTWPPAIGESSTACGATNSVVPIPPGGPAPATLESWPMNKVVHILQVARPYFQQNAGLNLGQMIQAYNQCSCVIRYLGEGMFRVTIGGVTTEINAEF